LLIKQSKRPYPAVNITGCLRRLSCLIFSCSLPIQWTPVYV